jgi:hypothetical protein
MPLFTGFGLSVLFCRIGSGLLAFLLKLPLLKLKLLLL